MQNYVILIHYLRHNIASLFPVYMVAVQFTRDINLRDIIDAILRW